MNLSDDAYVDNDLCPSKDHFIKNNYCWFRRFCLVHFFDAKRPNFEIYYTHAHIPGDSHMVTDTTADSKRAIFRLINPS